MLRPGACRAVVENATGIQAMSAVPGSPDVPDSPRECFPLFKRQSAEHVWKFMATAFALGPGHLLTARHAVDGRYSRVEDDGGLRFEGVETGFEWAVAVPGKDAEVREVRVRPTERPDDPRLDAVVLEVVEPTERTFEGVIWLAGLTDSELRRTGLGGVAGQVVGYPGSNAAWEAGMPAEWQERDERAMGHMATPGTRAGSGLVTFRVPEGGLDSGMSGGPAFLNSAYGRFCVGMARLGGERAATATVLGAGAILTWLRKDHGSVAVQILESRDLPPEAAAAYLEGIRFRMRTLLVPLLGASTTRNLGAARRELDLRTESEFIRLFVCLHAGPGAEGESEPPMRPDAELELYNEVREAYAANIKLSEHAEVVDGGGSELSRSVLQSVRRALTHCAGQERHAEPNQGDLTQDQHLRQKDYCWRLNEELDDGRRRLHVLDPVWRSICGGRDVVLAGGAGSGKSTVAQFVALALAMPRHRGTESKLRGLFEQAPHLRGRIPVFLRFRDLNGQLGVRRPPPSTALLVEAIESCVVAALGDEVKVLRRESLFLIWDGLDELLESARPAFARGLAAWRQGFGKGTQSLVTTRPTVYPPADPKVTPDAVGWFALEGTELWHLKRLDPMQQRELLEGFLSVHGTGDVHKRAEEVFGAIRKGDLGEMAADPLMLAALARLSEERRRNPGTLPLPRHRVDVLSEIIDLMLHRWESDRAGAEEGRLGRALKQAGMAEGDLRCLLARLALDSMGSTGPGDFTRDSLVGALKPISIQCHEVADALSEHAGLLRPLEVGSLSQRVAWFEFPVRTYRNFLAAEALLALRTLPSAASAQLRAAHQAGLARFLAELFDVGLDGVLAEVQPGAPEPEHARQLLTLAAAKAVGVHRVSEYVDAFAEVAARRLNAGIPAMPLIEAAVRLAVESGQWVVSDAEGPVRWSREGGGDVGRLLEVAGRMTVSPAESRQAQAAAASLGSLLGKAPEEAATVRVEWLRVGELGRLGFLRGDELNFGGGGAAPCDRVQHPFYLARFAVTVELFDRIAREAGLERSRFGTLHTHWPVPRFSIPSHPVVGVDWVTATRWCAVLTEWLRAGRLEGVPDEVRQHPDQWEVRLPEEWEWEFAARGPLADEPPRPTTGTGWVRVPWGWATEEEIAGRVNCNWQFSGTTPVTFAGDGNQSPWGILGMAGGVWEWCRTPLVQGDNWTYPADYEVKVRELQDDPGVLRVVRGGGWSDLPVGCRCADRYALPPGLRGLLGFRPVLAPVPSGAGGGGAGRG